MIRAILGKEWRQHRLTLVMVVMVLAGGVPLLALAPAIGQTDDTPLAALRLLLLMLLPVVCLVLGQALVASEYRLPVHAFIDGIPLSRGWMVTLKYLVGLFALLMGLGLALGVAVWIGRTTDVVSARQFALTAARSSAQVWLIYSFVFAWAFTGRYRVAIALTVLMVLVFLPTLPGRDLDFAMPWALVTHDFAYERYDYPVAALASAVAFSVIWTAAAFILGVANGGRYGSALAQRMSSRERTVITSLLLTIAALRFTYDTALTIEAPLHFPGAIERAGPPARVVVATTVSDPQPDEQAAMDRAADWIASDLRELAAYLGCEGFPPVYVIHRRDVYSRAFESGVIKPEQGALLRADLRHVGHNGTALRRRILREALLARSLGRLGREEMAWVLDGFEAWWPGIDADQDSADVTEPEVSAASGAIIAPGDLDTWLTVRHRLGEEGAGALAASGLRFAGRRYGADARRAFLGDILGRRVRRNATASLRDVLQPVGRRWRRATGVTLEQFTLDWAEWQASAERSAGVVPQ